MRELEIQHKHQFNCGLRNTRPPDLPGERGIGRYGLNPLISAANDLAKHPGSTLIAGVVRVLSDEIQRYRAMPGQKLPLESYVAVMGRIVQRSEQILRSLAAMPDGGRGMKEIRDAALAARDFASCKLAYYNELRALSQPQAIMKIKEVVKGHFTTIAGKHLVNMAGSDKHLEYFIPTHQTTTNAARAWGHYASAELAAGRDPYSSLVDFLLTLESDEDTLKLSRTYLGDAARDCYRLLYRGEVKALEGERMVHALYRYDAGHRGARYEPHLDGQDPLNRLACRYLPYTTVEYTNHRAALSDLAGGDLYVMDSGYRIYTCHSGEFHSRLLAGNAVMGAGVIVVKEGKVRAIDNKSGHYRPTWKHLHQVVCELEFHGVFAPDAVVGLMLSDDATMFFTVDDFIELGNRQFSFTATREVLERYRATYPGVPPVPASQVELLAQGDRQWPKGASGKDRWREFLKAAFPKAVKPLLDGVERLLKVVPVPTPAQWKKKSDAGLFASRHEALQRIDSGLENYHRVLNAQADRLIPDGAEIATAVTALEGAIERWLSLKQGTKESTRRPEVENLQKQVQAARAILSSLRPPAEENMAQGDARG